MFLFSEDVIWLFRKLRTLCDSSILTYGPKRPLLDAQYPELCPFFDLITERVPQNQITVDLGALVFYQSLGWNKTTLAAFKHQLMTYASENLIKINAFIDSPYLSKFETDEVCFPSISQTSKHVQVGQGLADGKFVCLYTKSRYLSITVKRKRVNLITQVIGAGSPL